MNFSEKSFVSQKEILKRKTGGEITAPITLASGAFTNGVCKAGNPISAAGAKVNDGTAIGILLSDVYAERPIGTIVKGAATINTANANANAGITIATTVKSALTALVFE